MNNVKWSGGVTGNVAFRKRGKWGRKMENSAEPLFQRTAVRHFSRKIRKMSASRPLQSRRGRRDLPSLYLSVYILRSGLHNTSRYPVKYLTTIIIPNWFARRKPGEHCRVPAFHRLYIKHRCMKRFLIVTPWPQEVEQLSVALAFDCQYC